MTTTKPAFRIGERVRAIDAGGMDAELIGRIGTVEAIDPPEPDKGILESVRVRWDGGGAIYCGAYQFVRCRR
jgi:hypothetical protein